MEYKKTIKIVNKRLTNVEKEISEVKESHNQIKEYLDKIFKALNYECSEKNNKDFLDNDVLVSSFIPPNNDYIFRNSKLIKQYQKISGYPLTIIESRIGFGKTTTLVDFLKNDYRDCFCWYSIKEENINNITFWGNIIAVINNKIKLSRDRKSVV